VSAAKIISNFEVGILGVNCERSSPPRCAAGARARRSPGRPIPAATFTYVYRYRTF